MTESTFAAYFRKLYPQFAYYASSLVYDYEVDDVMQDSFMELWLQIDNIEDESHMRAFLCRTIHNRCLNVIKHRGVVNAYAQSEKSIALKRMEYCDTHSSEIEAALESEEKRQRVEQEINKLPDKMRQVFMMSYMHNMKSADIAMIMGTSQRTVETQIYKALKKLKQNLTVIIHLFAFFMFFE